MILIIIIIMMLMMIFTMLSQKNSWVVVKAIIIIITITITIITIIIFIVIIAIIAIIVIVTIILVMITVSPQKESWVVVKTGKQKPWHRGGTVCHQHAVLEIVFLAFCICIWCFSCNCTFYHFTLLFIAVYQFTILTAISPENCLKNHLCSKDGK